MTTARIIYTAKQPWRAPVGSAAHEMKWGRVMPMKAQPYTWWGRLFRRG